MMGTVEEALNLRQMLKSVLPGQHDVEQDEIDAALRKNAIHFRRVGRGARGEAVFGQDLFQNLGDRLVILHEQNAAGNVGRVGKCLCKLRLHLRAHLDAQICLILPHFSCPEMCFYVSAGSGICARALQEAQIR